MKILIAFLKFWNLLSLRSQFNEYVIDKKMFIFLFLISTMIFLFFSKNNVFSICEKKKYNVALYILHAIEYAISKNCIYLNFYLQKQWVDERDLLSRWIKTMILRSYKRVCWLIYKKSDKIEIFYDKKNRWVWILSLSKELIMLLCCLIFDRNENHFVLIDLCFAKLTRNFAKLMRIDDALEKLMFREINYFRC